MEYKNFAKQPGPAYIFRGKYVEDRVSLTRLFFDFPIGEILNRPHLFYSSVKNVYLLEKRLNPIDDAPRLMDLSILKNVSAADFHLKVHAITGLPELCTSNTESIPYWDRQSVEFALKHHFDDDEAGFYMQESDIESVNGLRVFLNFIVPKYVQSRDNLKFLLKRKKNFTRTDISSIIKEQYNAWSVICSNYERVFVAKLKHLIFCADKLECWDIRSQILKEVDVLVENIGLNKDKLTIDLGIDGGVTTDTYRPAYQIQMLPQLKHLGKEEISVSSDISVRWSFEQQRKSLGRLSGEQSLLKEPKEYILDWKF